jgi:uncharacterized protein YdgA (DUF945 family)
MKKSIVAGLLLLALVVLISPGLVGHLAERGMSGQLDLATDERQEFVVAATHFDRHWFSSSGQHRIEFADSGAGAALRQQLGFASLGSPALIIDTEIEHGLIPVASMTRDKGSLLPGIGRAVSILSFQDAEGLVTELPGAVYTSIGLTGAVSSEFLFEPGAIGNFSWGDVDLRLETDAAQKRILRTGRIESIVATLGDTDWQITGLEIDSEVERTAFGFPVGESTLSVASVGPAPGNDGPAAGPLFVELRSELDGDKIDGQLGLVVTSSSLAAGDATGLSLQIEYDNLDAASLGRLAGRLSNARKLVAPGELLAALEPELKTFAASGFDIQIEQLDVQFPDGVFEADLRLQLDDTEPSNFAWTGVLLDLAAGANVRIPVSLYEYALTINPDFATLAGLGYLKKTGDHYLLEAQYKKGLLTINGAPMAVPLPAN